MNLCFQHCPYEERAPKRATQRSSYVEKDTRRSLRDETGAGNWCVLPGSSSGGCLDDGLFSARAALDNLACRGIDDEVVGVGRARDNGFPKAGIGIDHHLASLASEWVGREEDASALRHDHTLYNNRHAHGARIDAQAAAVAHSALGPQRRPAALDCCEHGL